MNKLWYISQVSIFETLSEADLQELDHMAPMVHFNGIPNGKIIQDPDTIREGLFFIKEGKLSLYKLHPDGKQYTAGILGKGNMFGEIDSFSFGTNGYYIETMEKSILCSLDKHRFEQFLLQRPQLALKFLNEFSRMIKEKEELVEILALGSVQDRILYLLLKLSRKFGIVDKNMVKIDIPLSHQEIGHMIGATRESVSIVLLELSKLEMIRTSRKSISIDPQKAKNHLKYN
jgi:CRP-like cAMP-binding protein